MYFRFVFFRETKKRLGFKLANCVVHWRRDLRGRAEEWREFLIQVHPIYQANLWADNLSATARKWTANEQQKNRNDRNELSCEMRNEKWAVQISQTTEFLVLDLFLLNFVHFILSSVISEHSMSLLFINSAKANRWMAFCAIVQVERPLRNSLTGLWAKWHGHS